MTKTVRLPDDLHEELKARNRPDETMAETIARFLHRPHPEETRAMLSEADAAAVADAVEGMYDDESDRLRRARDAFGGDDPADTDGDPADADGTEP